MSSRKVARVERATVELRETRANLLEAAAKLIRISGVHSLTHAATGAVPEEGGEEGRARQERASAEEEGSAGEEGEAEA